LITRPSDFGGQRFQTVKPAPPRQRRQPAFQQIDFFLTQDQAGPRFHDLAKKLEILTVHTSLPLITSSMLCGISCSGRTRLQIPALATAPGIPQTTLVSSS